MTKRALLSKFVATLMRSDYPRRKKVLVASFRHAAVICGGPTVDHLRHRARIEFNQRWFSSEVHPLVAEDTLEGRWRHATNKVLDSQTHPVGSFDTLTWQMCVSLLLWWVEKGPEGVERSLILLDRLVDEAAAKTTATTTTSSPKHGFQLDIYVLHAVLKNWNQSLRNFKTDILPSAMLSRIDGYLERSDCLHPNIATYTMILDGASHCPMPQERLVLTEQLLQRLIQDSETNPHLRPTVVTFGTVINAMAQSGSLACAEKAEAMLRRLQEEHWLDVKPNAILYTNCIHAWAKAGNVHRAENLLKEMYEECTIHGNTDLKPNRRTFNTVLAAFSKDVSSTAGQSAEALLRKMRALYDNGTLDSNPDVVSYNCVLNAMVHKPNDPDLVNKAESLVREMIEHSLAPNQITFTALIRTIVTSTVTDKAQRARAVLQLMKERGVPPSVYIRDKVRTLEQHMDIGRYSGDLGPDNIKN